MSNVLCKTNKDIPQEMLLGNLLFTNITDMQIPESGLIGIFQNNNIPERYVRKISKADAFRRATSSAKNKYVYMTDTSTGITYKHRVEVDEVKSDCDGIKRIIGIKSIDEQNEDIAYIPIGYVNFDRKSELISMAITPPYDTIAGVVDLFNMMDTNYQTWSVFHNKDTVRNIINNIITDTHPISLMPTGLCKFVPSSSTSLMYNLKQALEDMTVYSINGGNNTMELIPIIDTEEQRGLIQKNFSIEITDELFNFTQELKDVLVNKKTLSTRTALSYIEKFKLLNEKAKEYESLLGIYMQGIHTQITEAVKLVNDNTTV